MTRIRIHELETVVNRGDEFPNDLILADYENLLANKFIVTQQDWDKLDKSICFNCRAI